MIALITSAFIIGALGSTHCIGMCGPIALSLPSVNESTFSKFIGSFLYNIGRTITYACLGFFLGVIGNSFSLLGLQRSLSVVLGVLILFFLFFPIFNKWFGSHHFLSGFYSYIRMQIAKLFKRRDYSSIFFIGLLNGFLPCGLVYIALAGALSTNSPINSALFMVFFGLGTLPLLWTFTFFGQFATLKLRRVFRLTYPVIVFTMACLLILRGFGINISPKLFTPNTSVSKSLIECHN